MIEHRPFSSLGHAQHGWLDAHHHFSFAGYRDPNRMGWGPIRVWNDDEIAAHTGFSSHAHADMEIVTYVRSGAISHEDSLGNTGRTFAGDVQVMSAGTGIRHAEYNHEDETTTLFQIWIEPRERGGSPSWGTRPFPKGERSGRFITLASGYDGEHDALPIQADARVMGATLKAGERITVELGQGSHAYLVPIGGSILVDGQRIDARDGAAISDQQAIVVVAIDNAEIVLVQAT